MNFSEKLQEYYSSGYEKTRLTSDKAHSIEFLTTVHYLDEILPSNTKVLDCCAGGGIYSYYLAERGFRVTAADLSAYNVKTIKADKNSELLDGVYNLNVLDMSVFENENFDVVLCMGAFYHLKTEEERKKCVAECLRVLKKGGLFVLAYINRNPCVLYQFWQEPKNIAKQTELIKTGDNNMFYAVDFDEIDKVVEEFSLSKIKNIGVDGSIYPLQKKINSLNKKRFNDFLNYHFLVCEEPSIIGNSMHGLLIARKDN
ncbi:MAG: class I SAM-dependent methyltransferase [Eubacterium sp.]|nr:class I SAM-dependent methyltransferase [Eubacterium sp.]